MDDIVPTQASRLPQTLSDIPADSKLGKLIDTANEVELRRTTKSLYSPPHLTMGTVGLSSTTSRPSKYHFSLAETNEKMDVCWYSVRAAGLRHIGLAVGWCSQYPDGILFYQVGRRSSDHFKIWEGESEPADDDFSHRLLIIRSKVRDSIGTNSGLSEMEVEDARDEENNTLRRSTRSATLAHEDPQSSVLSSGLQEDPIIFLDNDHDIHSKEEPNQDEHQTQQVQINAVFKTSTHSNENHMIIPWEFCNTNERIFLAAVAAGVLESSEQESVLSVTIVNPTGERHAMRILKFWDAMFEALRAKVEEVSGQVPAGSIELVIEKL